jgi:hypothetical protein
MMENDGCNPHWSEIGHYHNFTRERLFRLLEGNGFKPLFYNVSERCNSCMDVIAIKS